MNNEKISSSLADAAKLSKYKQKSIYRGWKKVRKLQCDTGTYRERDVNKNRLGQEVMTDEK